MFDIDHLYLARYNVNEKGGYEFEADSTEALQNEIISCILSVLKDSKTPNIGYKSIDNDTALVESIAAQIPEEGNTKRVAFNFGTLHEQVTRKNDYITGKTGIGPFALNVTSHILTTLYKVKFKENNFTKLTGITGFDRILDEKDNQISSWLSAFINAHVDIVKDPYISKLNVNSFTYNMINLLTRNGKGEAGLYFLCQPIIRQLAKADNDAKSQFTRDPKQYKSAFDMRSKIVEKIFPDICGVAIDNQEIVTMINNDTNGSLTRKANIVNEVLGNIDMMKKIAQDPNGFGRTTEAKEFQKKTYMAWMILDKYSNALNQLVQYTKIDTRKQGKNFIEMSSYYEHYNELAHPMNPFESIFDMESIDNLVKNTWIEQKTSSAIREPMAVMQGQSFQGTDVFIQEVNDIAYDFSATIQGVDRRLKGNSKVLRKIAQACSTQIKVNYFARLADALGINTKALFEGNHTVYDRFNMLSSCITRDIQGLSRLKDNYLLRHLAPYLSDDRAFNNGKLVQKPKFLQVLNSMDDSKMSADMFIEAWEELLNDETPNVRNFARDLIFYAMFTSGDTKGFNKLAKYVPMSFFTAKPTESMPSFAEYISIQLKNPYIDEDQLAANCMMDRDMISRATYNDFWFAAKGQDKPAVLIHKELNYEDAPDYVAVRYDGAKFNDQTSYNLYKRIGEVMVEGETKQVYAMIPKRGWTEKAGLTVYEYGNMGLSINSTAVTAETVNSQLSALEEFLKNPQYLNEKELLPTLRSYNTAYLTPRNSTSLTEAQEQPTEAVQRSTVSDTGTSKNGQTVYISRQYYYKGQPQKHPNVQYVFTENYQAAAAVHGWANNGYSKPTLNVSAGSTGTNQACIRTDAQGNVSKNAFGLVVKAIQQDLNRRWVNDTTACIQNTPQWIQAFKNVNDYILKSIDTSKPVVFPASIGLGKAALPKECASWLRKELADRFNIISEIEENPKPQYKGWYGLRIKGVGSTQEAQEIQIQELQKQALADTNQTDMQEAKDITNYCKGGK